MARLSRFTFSFPNHIARGRLSLLISLQVPGVMLFKVHQPRGSALGPHLHSPSVSVLAVASHIRLQLAAHPGHQRLGLGGGGFPTAPASSTMTVLSARQIPAPGSVPPPSLCLYFRGFGSPMSAITSVSLSSVWLLPYFSSIKERMWTLRLCRWRQYCAPLPVFLYPTFFPSTHPQ